MDVLNISYNSSESDLSESDEGQRTAEERLADYHPKNKDDRTRAVLTNFVRFLPVDGKKMLVEFIASSPNDEILYNLFRHLLTSILWPVKTGTLPLAIAPSPFNDNDLAMDKIASLMDTPLTVSSQTELRQLCLERDNLRCMATGMIDDSNPISSTRLAHILPLSIGKSGDTEQDQKLIQIWATLVKCFPDLNIGPADLNNPSNLMTLQGMVCQAFSEFRLGFEPIPTSPQGDEYTAVVVRGQSEWTTFLQALFYPGRGCRKCVVKFERHGETELPSPILLQTHAALGKILYGSGMAKYIDRKLENGEDA